MDASPPFPAAGRSGRHPWSASGGNTASRPESLLAFVSLIVLVSAPFIVGDQPQGADSLNPIEMLKTVSDAGDQYKQFVLLAIYGACAAALVLKERPRSWLFIGAPLGLLLLWTFGSTFWSYNPEVTFRRSIALSGALVMGVYIGLRFETRRLLLLLCLAGVTVLTFSLVLMVVAPLHGLDFDGRLRGVSSDKNHFASFAALVLLSALTLTGMGRGSRQEALLRGAAGALAISCMLLARSTSVIPVLAAALASLGLGHAMLRASPRLLAFMPLAAALALLLFLVAAANSGEIAEALGKDPDISGRTLVWAFSFKLILLRPVAGYGLGAVWTGGDSPGAVFWAISHLAVPHAHNGYIQLALELGAVGVALFAAACLMLVLRVLWLTIYVRQRDAPWSFSFLTLFLLANYSEAWLWIGNETMIVTFITLIVRTNVEYRKASHARTARQLIAARA